MEMIITAGTWRPWSARILRQAAALLWDRRVLAAKRRREGRAATIFIAWKRTWVMLSARTRL